MFKKTDEGEVRFAARSPALSTAECVKTLQLVYPASSGGPWDIFMETGENPVLHNCRQFPCWSCLCLQISRKREGPVFGPTGMSYCQPEQESNPQPYTVWGGCANHCSGVLPHLSFSSHLISMCVLHPNTCSCKRRFKRLTRLLEGFVTQTLSLCNLLQINEQNRSWTSVVGSVERPPPLSLSPALVASLLCQLCCINKPALPRSSSSSSLLSHAGCQWAGILQRIFLHGT